MAAARIGIPPCRSKSVTTRGVHPAEALNMAPVFTGLKAVASTVVIVAGLARPMAADPTRARPRSGDFDLPGVLFRFRNKISRNDELDEYSRIKAMWHAAGSLTFFWGL
jgi:hypothetical protein